jgi:hypothetical protein
MRNFASTNRAVIQALTDYLAWLKTDLLPRSNGDFRIGAETFRKKLAYDEMVDLPLDRLLEIGTRSEQEPGGVQSHCEGVGADEGRRGEVLEELGQNHPAPDQLLQTFRDTFDWLIGSFARIILSRFHPTVQADSGRDAAVHAGDDVRFDGYAGAV